MARKSEVRQEFEKQIKRIKDIVRRGEKKGLTFDESPIPEIPKRVTRKKVEELKDITYREVWSKGKQKNEKGEEEYYSPYEASKKAHEKAKETIKQKKEKQPKEPQEPSTPSEPSYDWTDDTTPDSYSPSDYEDDEDEEDYEYPYEGQTMYDNLIEEMEGGRNVYVSSFIYEYLQDTKDLIGEEELYRRLEEAEGSDLLSLAQTSVDDSDGENVKQSTMALLEIINGGSVEGWVAEELQERINLDCPTFRYKKFGYKNPSKIKKEGRKL